jgi:hypothetical protein
LHVIDEVQSGQFKGQAMQEPLDKNLPISQFEHDWDVDKVHVKQFFDEKQHSFDIVKE